MKPDLKTPSKAALSLIALGSLGLTTPASAETFDFEFQAGQTEVATNKFQEIDKRGYALGLTAMKRIPLRPIGDIAFGLGAFTTKVKGKKSEGGITQDLDTSLLSLDLRYLYTFLPGFSAGPIVRGYFGKGAKFGVQNNDDVDFQFAPGVILRYAFQQIAYEPAISLHYSHDANIAKRNVQTILFGVGMSVGFGASLPPAALVPVSPSVVRDTATSTPEVEASKAAEVPAAPAPAPVQDTQPVPLKAEEVKPAGLEPLIFNFAPSSTRLNGISREKAKALAKVLTEHPEDYSKIHITGHSDKSGDPQQNIDLSKKRTEAFCDLLASRGVPRKKMRCEAMDFQKLLPDLPENAEEHRRIEVVFEELTPAQTESWQRILQKALQL